MTTVQDMVEEFHRKFNSSINDRSRTTVWHRLDLLQEQYDELYTEITDFIDSDRADLPPSNLDMIAKKMADLVYVVYGTAVALGIDLDLAVRLVHESNMSKALPNGQVRKNSAGKILKGPNYQPPDMSDTIKEL